MGIFFVRGSGLPGTRAILPLAWSLAYQVEDLQDRAGLTRRFHQPPELVLLHDTFFSQLLVAVGGVFKDVPH